MTKVEATVASRGRALPCAPEKAACRPNFADYQPSLYVPDLEIAGFPAIAQLAFDAQGRLNATYLVFSTASFERLTDALMGTYGQRVETEATWPPSRAWLDEPSGTIVKLWGFPGTVKTVIEYKPIASGL
jgi:hypothetical protein